MNPKIDNRPFIPLKKIIPLEIGDGAGPGTPK
jgi:hypothetical protein